MQEQASVVVASALGLLQQTLRFRGKLSVAKDLLREAQISHIRFLPASPARAPGDVRIGSVNIIRRRDRRVEEEKQTLWQNPGPLLDVEVVWLESGE